MRTIRSSSRIPGGGCLPLVPGGCLLLVRGCLLFVWGVCLWFGGVCLWSRGSSAFGPGRCLLEESYPEVHLEVLWSWGVFAFGPGVCVCVCVCIPACSGADPSCGQTGGVCQEVCIPACTGADPSCGQTGGVCLWSQGGGGCLPLVLGGVCFWSWVVSAFGPGCVCVCIPACTGADPSCGQTDTCKNITFATSLRTVKIIK